MFWYISFILFNKAAIIKKEKEAQKRLIKKERKTLRTVAKV